MALDIYSGKDAYVDGVGCIQSWQASDAVSAQRYSASCTPGATNVGPGVKNWTGQCAGIGAFPSALIPGTGFDFIGVVNNDAGAGDLLSLFGYAWVEQLTIDINKETAAVISWQASLGFDGNPTEDESGAEDTTLATPQYGDSLDIKIGAGIGVTIASDNCAIRTAQIVIRCPLTPWLKNGTTYRKPGNLEADCSFSVYNPSQETSVYAENTLAKVRFMTTASAYWELNKVRFLGKSNFVVDRNATNVIGYTVNGQWNSHDAGAKGHLTYYNGTTATDLYGDSTP